MLLQTRSCFTGCRHDEDVGHNSLLSEGSQSSYPASESSSQRDDEDEDEFLAEPLEEHPRYTKLQDLNRSLAGPPCSAWITSLPITKYIGKC